MDIESLCREMIEKHASDLHLKVGSPPTIRVDGELHSLNYPTLTPEQTWDMARAILPERLRPQLEECGSIDASYSLPKVARFRVNIFHQRGAISLAMRLVNFQVAGFEELGLPKVTRTVSGFERGLILVTGITGSGKSTTLASMVDFINKDRRVHIVTIEDPIEYLHRDHGCLINQIEVGLDIESFNEALRRVLRQDPDVILIGEMRDKETIISAVKAAETGHLVLSTLHTSDAVQTVDRILKYFDPEEQDLIRMQLSLNLRAVLSQRLLRKKGGGRTPAIEVMIGTPIIQKLILEGRTGDLRQAIQNQEEGMQTFDQALLDLNKRGIIELDEALSNADNPKALSRMIKGGYSDGDKASLIGRF